MICGTGNCQVEDILHSPSAGLGMLNSLQMQLHAEDGKEYPSKIP